MKPAILACCLAGVAAAAARGAETKPVGELTLHDFAAKWMMQQDDLADRDRYREANRALLATADPRPRVVLMGDSITFHWGTEDLPAGDRILLVNRGIAGQNTSQMLLRFEDDAIALKPAAVVILGGTNDLRAYQGDPAAAAATAIDRIIGNITAMADIAQGRGVKVILAAVPPIGGDQALTRDPAAIVKLNDRLKEFAASRHYPFADYYAALADSQGALPAALSSDGLHPNANGYHLMEAKLKAALTGLGPLQRE